jgi:hypothetical protein
MDNTHFYSSFGNSQLASAQYQQSFAHEPIDRSRKVFLPSPTSTCIAAEKKARAAAGIWMGNANHGQLGSVFLQP